MNERSRSPRSVRDPQGDPFGAPDTLRRALPFAVVALIAEASSVLPPGASRVPALVASLGLFAVIAAATLGLPWPRLPRWSMVLPPVAYVAVALLLKVSQGDASLGYQPVLILPILWTGLHHRRWESGVVVLSIVTGLVSVSLVEHDSVAVLLRRSLLWGVAGALIAVSAHALREQLSRTIRQRQRAANQAEVLAQAAHHLAAASDPVEVVAAAVRASAELVTAPGETGSRSEYLRVGEDRAGVRLEMSVCLLPGAAGGRRVGDSWAVDDHPRLRDAVSGGRLVAGTVRSEDLGPSLRDRDGGPDPVHGAWAPVAPNGVLHGVLAVESAEAPIPEDLLGRFVALTEMVELALANVAARDELERLSLTDDLTGLLNRRGFRLVAAQEIRLARRLGLHMSVFFADIDHLKQINDQLGHGAGSRAIVEVADLLRGTLRSSDVVGRWGGDEFCALVVGAPGAADGEAVLRRLEQAMRDRRRSGERDAAWASIGYVDFDPAVDTSLDRLVHAADARMYEAKRRNRLAAMEPRASAPAG